MSTRRKFERMMQRTGLTAMGGPATAEDVLPEAAAIAKRVEALVYAKQPMSPLAVLLALDVVKGIVAKTVEQAEVSELDRERFWGSYETLRAGCAPNDGFSIETQQKIVSNGTVTVSLGARLEKLVTAEDATELMRQQAEALRQFADLIDLANAKTSQVSNG